MRSNAAFTPAALRRLPILAALVALAQTATGRRAEAAAAGRSRASEAGPRAQLVLREGTDDKGAPYSYVALEGEAVDAVAGWLLRHHAAEVPPAYVANRVTRDGPHHHATLVTPPEMEQLQRERGVQPAAVLAALVAEAGPSGGPWLPLGLGAAHSDATGNSARYCVVAWPAGQAARRALGLARPQDFHITLGFQPADVHDVPKDASTLVAGRVDEREVEALAEAAGLGLTRADRTALLPRA